MACDQEKGEGHFIIVVSDLAHLLTWGLGRPTLVTR